MGRAPVTLHSNSVAWELANGPTGRLLKISYTILRKRLAKLARQAGLTHAQWSALGVLYHFPGSTNSDLETILLIERPSVTSLIKGMEQNGWVVRKADANDGRVQRFFLTERGKHLAEETRSFATHVDQEVLSALSHAEVLELRKLLVKVIRSAPSETPSAATSSEGTASVATPSEESSGPRSGSHLPIGYWLKRADEILTLRIDEVQEKNGLVRMEWQVLNILHETSPVTRRHIHEIMRPFADVDAVEAVLGRLAARGLIESTDGHAEGLRLTDRGRHAHHVAAQTQQEIRRRAVQGISEVDYATTVRSLQRLVANLEDDASGVARTSHR